MSSVYDFTDSNGNPFLPLANGVIELDGINVGHEKGEVRLAFYNSGRQPLAAGLAPTQGTLTFAAGTLPGQYLAATSNGTVNAADVQSGLGGNIASYTPPFFNGPATHARVTLAGGITGNDAAFVRIQYIGE